MPLSRSQTSLLTLSLLSGIALTGVVRLVAQDKPAIARPATEPAERVPGNQADPDSDAPLTPEEEAAAAEEAESNRMAALVPIGRIFEGVKIPNYSGDSLGSVVNANFMRRADDEHLEMEMLEIVVYNRGEPDSRILTDRAIYDMQEKTLRSTTPARIVHRQFEMTGDRMLFDSVTRVGHLSGNVKTRIYNTDELMNSGGE